MRISSILNWLARFAFKFAVSGDLNAWNFFGAQGSQSNFPPTIASAATIAPTTKLTFVTGTTQVATITPPLAGFHELWLCFTNGSPGALLTSGNIQSAYTPIQNRPFCLLYDPSTAKYWVMSVT